MTRTKALLVVGCIMVAMGCIMVAMAVMEQKESDVAPGVGQTITGTLSGGDAKTNSTVRMNSDVPTAPLGGNIPAGELPQKNGALLSLDPGTLRSEVEAVLQHPLPMAEMPKIVAAEALKPEPLKAEPTTPKASEIEPAKPEPAKPEPAKPEPAKPEPAKPEPAKPEPAKPETAKAEPAKPEPVKPETAKAEPVKPEPVKPEPVKPEPVKPEPVKPEPVKPETAKAEPVKPEPVKPKPEPAKQETPKPETTADPEAESDKNMKAIDTAGPVKVEPGQKAIVWTRLELSDKTLVFRMSGAEKLEGKAFALPDPDRFVVDMQGAWAVRLPTVPANKFVKKIRFGKQDNNTRMVFDLASGRQGQMIRINPTTLEFRIR